MVRMRTSIGRRMWLLGMIFSRLLMALEPANRHTQSWWLINCCWLNCEVGWILNMEGKEGGGEKILMGQKLSFWTTHHSPTHHHLPNIYFYQRKKPRWTYIHTHTNICLHTLRIARYSKYKCEWIKEAHHACGSLGGCKSVLFCCSNLPLEWWKCKIRKEMAAALLISHSFCSFFLLSILFTALLTKLTMFLLFFSAINTSHPRGSW